MTILALDVASSTGWAFGGMNDAPQHGVFSIPPTGDDLGRFGVTFMAWLSTKCRELRPREIVFEAPILPSKTALVTTRKLHGLALLVECVAHLEAVPVTEIGNSEWRKHFLGAYYPPTPTRDELKRAVIAACRGMGWNPRGDDDADALGLLYVVNCLRNRDQAASDAVNRMGAAT